MQICGRHFDKSEIDWINTQVKTRPEINRAKLSRLFCRHVDWFKPDGGLKDMSCRVAMLRLEEKGLIRLPEPKITPGPVKAVKRTLQGEPRPDIRFKAGEVKLSIQAVDKRTSPLWNELIDRYHYLGYQRMGGAQMRFLVQADDQLIALLGFSAAAWKVQPRDSFIGWSETQRKKNLHLVVGNSRFLILPWVYAKNLASRILSLAAKQLPVYWQKRYKYLPVLMETFVEKNRFAGTCYQAANWICLGQTQGRGKWDRQNNHHKPVKAVWVYPLDKRFKEHLCR